MVLPDDVISPYKFLLIINNLKMIHQLFNEVNIPPLWEIAGNQNIAEIIDNGKVRGRIFYREHFKNRIVNFVEWFDEKIVYVQSIITLKRESNLHKRYMI